jgi:hypothetical protein
MENLPSIVFDRLYRLRKHAASMGIARRGNFGPQREVQVALGTRVLQNYLTLFYISYAASNL